MFKGNTWLLVCTMPLMLAMTCASPDGREYCEQETDCKDGNDTDYQVCLVQLQNARREARAYGCIEDYDELIDCIFDNSECDGDGSDEEWRFDSEDCEDDTEDFYDCLDDESDIIDND